MHQITLLTFLSFGSISVKSSVNPPLSLSPFLLYRISSGALIGAPTSNMFLLKPILQFVPEDKSKQVFQYIIRYATELSSRSRLQKFWQSSSFSLTDLIKSDLVDDALTDEFDWLSDTPDSEPSTPQSKEANSPRADPQLVRLFKSVNDQGTAVNDSEIIKYIREVKTTDRAFDRKRCAWIFE